MLAGLTVCLLAWPSLGARERQVHDVFNALLMQHHRQMQQLVKARNVSPFFMDVSFQNEAQVKNLLHAVSRSNAGYMQMSYTTYSNINGNRKMVNVSVIRNGSEVKLQRTTNDNGRLLKAVYDFNSGTGELKTGSFENKKLVHNDKYSI